MVKTVLDAISALLVIAGWGCVVVAAVMHIKTLKAWQKLHDKIDKYMSDVKEEE